ENRVLDVPDSIVGRLPEAVRLRVAAALSVPNVAVDLTADDVKGLLGATEPASGVATFAAPRLTVFNGQRAFIMVDHSTAKVAGPADHSGITLNTRASTDGHATSVAFTLTVKRRLPSNALTTNVFDSMFTLADGHSALYAATDAATPGHTLMLLIKPTAMMRQEIAEPKK
ncbi:MAG: hypothetical protein JWM57_3997, partial [Phycisphaerales bacterium]|nr:hypothetical protein [Phycisphaerales bacterium]